MKKKIERCKYVHKSGASLEQVDKEEESEIPTNLVEEIDKYISENIEFDRAGSAMDKWNKGAHLNRFDVENIARHFAEWQKRQDQETIELAEDHAMLAGRMKAKEEFDRKCQGCFDRDEVFHKGIQHAKEEMMKEGITVDIDDFGVKMYEYCVEKLGLTSEDKVKLYIFKDDGDERKTY